jgi:hypothetical protein
VIFPDLYHPFGIRTMQGACGAYIQARGVFAVQTGDGNILSFPEGDDLNAGAPGIADRMVLKGTDQFTHPAAAANIFRVFPVFKVPDPLSAHFNLRT